MLEKFENYHRARKIELKLNCTIVNLANVLIQFGAS